MSFKSIGVEKRMNRSMFHAIVQECEVDVLDGISIDNN